MVVAEPKSGRREASCLPGLKATTAKRAAGTTHSRLTMYAIAAETLQRSIRSEGGSCWRSDPVAMQRRTDARRVNMEATPRPTTRIFVLGAAMTERDNEVTLLTSMASRMVTTGKTSAPMTHTPPWM